MALPLTPIKRLLDCGLSLHRQGSYRQAIELYRQAVAADGGAAAHNLIAAALLELGRFGEAEPELRRAIALEPGWPPGLGHRGNALKALGRVAEAIASYRRSLAANAEDPLWLRNLGLALLAASALDDAAAAFRRSLTRRADDGEVLNSLGIVEMQLGDAASAERSFRRAVAAMPGLGDAVVNLALTRLDNGDPAAAEHDARRAGALAPSSADALNALAAARLALNRPEDAARLLRRALSQRPDFCEAHFNLGLAWMDFAQLKAAEIAALRALALKPGYAEAEWNLAFARLLSGEFRSGWRNYEARWRMRRFPTPLRRFPAPLWEGEPLAGRRILLHAEQGLGDTLQFIRYAPLVAARGGHVIVECQASLKRLIATMPAVRELRAQGEAPPVFDVHAPLLSLPRIFGTTLASIPNRVPYLGAPDEPPSPSRPTIGLVWAGSAAHRRDRARSLPKELARRLCRRLLAIDGVDLVSLQLGPRADEVDDIVPRLLPAAADFLDSARALAGISLLVSVDTAIVHLAGALARPALVVLPFLPDFRWLLTGSTSPWYPSAHLLRQPAPGDWEGVLKRVPGQAEAMLASLSRVQSGGS
ncbi:MAG: tetratricopeptide repeat protein [Proteobacteria bacterium]|nr:tetratricopeptide repeat protein [Pseudomonadota bacterium]